MYTPGLALRARPRDFSINRNRIAMAPVDIAALTNARKPGFSALIISDVKTPTGNWQLGRLQAGSG